MSGFALACSGSGSGSGGDLVDSPAPQQRRPAPSRGGSLARLTFAVVGDTRPPIEDDTAGYPVAVVTGIYADIEARRPHAAFVISTGDYVFASARAPGAAAAQIDLYMQARARYQGALYPAMGNHECTGATASNCGAGRGSGTSNGVTANYAAFLGKMLAPIGQSRPYYAIDFQGPGESWTAKLVFIAANAWTAEQGTWLDATLARPTTYTFVVRHEPAEAIEAPGVAPSEAIMARHPYTLALVGHSHTYRHSKALPREVVIGNGGAPLAGKEYGFGTFDRRSDGAIVVDMIRSRTVAPDPAFHFAVRPDGSATR
ncbi:MAG: metallophosphoesterase family protein [Polyangiaceae bacterium]